MACQIYMPLTQADYNQIKIKFSIKNDLDSQKLEQFMEQYPFLNWPLKWLKMICIYLQPITYLTFMVVWTEE